MSGFDTEYEFDDLVDVSLLTSGGNPIEIAVAGLDVGPGAVLRAEMAPAELVRAAQLAAFGLEGEHVDLDWDDDSTVSVSLRLVDALAGNGSVGDGEPVLRALAAPPENDETGFCSTGSWVLLEAAQSIEVPGDPDADLEIGLRTRWAG